MKSSKKAIIVVFLTSILLIIFVMSTYAWTPTLVENDPLVRMPGTQPEDVAIEGPNRCLNCHEGYDAAVEPGHNWKGSMMAQASRDFLFWSAMTVSAQDSVSFKALSFKLQKYLATFMCRSPL